MSSVPSLVSSRACDDHCRHCRYDVKKTLGEDACPFNSLYWDFLERHADTLASNPRMKLIYGSLRRMSDDKRSAMRRQATSFLDNLACEPSYGQGPHRDGYRPQGANP